MTILATISQAARRSAVTKKALTRTYFATSATHFSKNNVQKQEEIHQAHGSESTVHITHEGSDSDASFSPVVNHVFDD
ncbi:hypothetical protein G6F56_009586 [Rhizopus delemar]|nr:hypothetical protein G6F56_009586 [Rhizopus delemar]